MFPAQPGCASRSSSSKYWLHRPRRAVSYSPKVCWKHCLMASAFYVLLSTTICQVLTISTFHLHRSENLICAPAIQSADRFVRLQKVNVTSRLSKLKQSTSSHPIRHEKKFSSTI